MYYMLILIAVILFGGNFALNDVYRVMRGNSLKISVQFTLVSAVGGLTVLLIGSKGTVECTPFTLIMALLSSVNGMAFSFLGFKALGKTNISMYSLYSMLGGMLLPFLQGVLFYGEPMTVAKSVCCLFIFFALIITADRTKKLGGGWYYAGIFILNGMSGVITKLFTSLDYPKADATSFSVLSSFTAIIISAVILLLFFRKKDKPPKNTKLSVGISLAGGIANRVANLLLVISLMHIESSAQYPLVTGGVMIVSTLICYLRKQKPSNRELLSVALAFMGMLAMFVIPV